MGKISGSRKTLLPCALNLGSGNTEDVGTSSFEVCYLPVIDIKACYLETCLAQKKRKW